MQIENINHFIIEFLIVKNVLKISQFQSLSSRANNDHQNQWIKFYFRRRSSWTLNLRWKIYLNSNLPSSFEIWWLLSIPRPWWWCFHHEPMGMEIYQPCLNHDQESFGFAWWLSLRRGKHRMSWLIYRPSSCPCSISSSHRWSCNQYLRL